MVRLSIVIPYYKTYDLTKELLDRLVPQLNNEVEVFLVDDGCKESRLDEYKDTINIIHLEKNGGGAKACNTGIRKAQGDYVAIIDSDDLITEDYIKDLLKVIKNHNEDVIIFNWQDKNTGEIVRHPCNYAPWKAIYKKKIMPLFVEGWIYSYDVPFQEELSRKEHSTYYYDKVLYLYNSNREGNLTLEKEKARRVNMVKLRAKEKFTLGRFNEIENIVRAGKDVKGLLNKDDVFECDNKLATYLLGANPLGRAVVEIVEVTPEKTEERKEETPKKRTRKSKK